ncbi:MAG: glycosyltransferase [Bacteroidales bacterium]|jgi:glycosyltransferase involved in cell wall biosynthesis|nr:glycosyltransferase [Bacteroidales bacterium]
MGNNKILSVVIFTYNHENYIEQTILSVVNQKTKYDYEIVVNDDCSTDNTYHVIQSLQSKYPDLIRIIHNEKNLGLNKSFENAIRTVKSEYVALLGGDDYWITTDKIEKRLNILQSDKLSVMFTHLIRC